MRINPDKLIAGQTARKMRDFCRTFQHVLISPEGIGYFFGKDITAELRKARIIITSPELSEYFVLAAEGQRWANLLLLPRLGRVKAEQMVFDLLARATAINSNPNFLYWTDEIHAFGSYLTDLPTVGDIDLIIHFKRRPVPPAFEDYKEWRCDHAERAGKDDFKFFDYGLTEVRQQLRARNPYLSFHKPEQHKQLRGADKLIYTRLC